MPVFFKKIFFNMWFFLEEQHEFAMGMLKRYMKEKGFKPELQKVE
jgi:hypothetical protein